MKYVVLVYAEGTKARDADVFPFVDLTNAEVFAKIMEYGGHFIADITELKDPIHALNECIESTEVPFQKQVERLLWVLTHPSTKEFSQNG